MRFSKWFASLIILFVLGLHIPPYVQEFYGTRQTFWPFMAWGMYRNAYDGKRPIQSTVRRTIGITRQGEEVMIVPPVWPRFFNLFRATPKEPIHFVGLNIFGLSRLYLTPIWQGDMAVINQFVKWLNQRRDDPIIALRLESETYTLTEDGLVKEENPDTIYNVLN
jgi:hypothetical protein